MDCAAEDVLVRKHPVSLAARQNGVPRSTLRARLDSIQRFQIKAGLDNHTDFLDSASPHKAGMSGKLDGAMEAVKVDKMAVSKAAQVFGIPSSTLRDHLAGKGRKGKATKFTAMEEKVLVEILLTLSRVGMPLNKSGLMKLVVTAGQMKGN